MNTLSSANLLTPQLLVAAYSQGWFPMADGRHGEIGWYSPDPRCILPLDQFHIPHGLRRAIAQKSFHMTHDRAFEEVMRCCAAPRKQESETWINDQIIDAYVQLHHLGLAHSIEAWRRDAAAGKRQAQDTLVGGLYGVSLGGAFFGESMFSLASNASKICLVHLVHTMRQRGMTLLDVQFRNPHLEQFGIVEVTRDEYLRQLNAAIGMKGW